MIRSVRCACPSPSALLVAALLSSASGVLAPRPVLAQPSPKVARAVRVTRPPRIDGRLDDDSWTKLAPITDFVQRQPSEGQAPTEATEVYIAYDNEALYVAARMRRRNIKDLARAVTRRDGFGNTERFTITFDPQMDRRTAVLTPTESGIDLARRGVAHARRASAETLVSSVT